MHVSALNFYPVKSCAGIPLQTGRIGPRGFLHDREWMIVDSTDQFITQRELPKLAHIIPEVLENGNLVLRTSGWNDIDVPVFRDGSERKVTIWRDTCIAIDQGNAVADWLGSILDSPCRLVRIADTTIRQVDQRYASRATDQVGFADGYPFLLIGETSLADLNTRLDVPLSMNRFRPNIVIAGSAPYAEDTWQHVRIGAIEFAGVKACARCAITTTDQVTLQRGKEPLRTLATYRNSERGVLFGQNMVHSTNGTINVGDPLEILGAV